MSAETRRLLVTGGSGTLGGPLCARAEAAGWDVTATYLTRPDRVRAGRPVRLDLRDRAALAALVRDVSPHAIIHTAVTERSGPGYAEAIRLAGRHVAEVAAESGTRMVALSTDLVFDGTEARYTEDSTPRPLKGSDYGRAKLDAERATLVICPAALVVRTSLIYDFHPENAQVGWMLRALARGETLRLYTDQLRCPIWAVNLADTLLELAEMGVAGLLHVAGPACISRYELGVTLLAALGHDPAAYVVAASAPDTAPKKLDLSVDRARALLRRTRLLALDEARRAWAGA